MSIKCNATLLPNLHLSSYDNSTSRDAVGLHQQSHYTVGLCWVFEHIDSVTSECALPKVVLKMLWMMEKKENSSLHTECMFCL